MGKKHKASKVRKTIDRAKLPKQLRKSADMVVELAKSPLAREVVSAALFAGAAAIAKRRGDGASQRSGHSEAAQPSVEVDKLFTEGKDIGSILAQGVITFFDALLKPQVSDEDPKAIAPAPGPTGKKAGSPAPRKRAAPKKNPLGRNA